LFQQVCSQTVMGGQVSTKCCVAQSDPNDVSGSADIALLTDEEIGDRAKEPLSEQEIVMVETTWKKAAGLGVETVGVILFKHIFTLAPDAIGLFSFKKEPNVRTYGTPGLKAHGVKVVSTVGAAVDSIRNVPALVPVLQELAMKHVGYGVQPAHFDIVGKALMLTFKDGLGREFTNPVQVAWKKVWGTVSSAMIAVMSVELAKQTKTVEEPKKVDALATQAPISDCEVHLVQESWAKIVVLGNEDLGIALFRHIFMEAPEALQLFPFKDDWKNLYESPRLKAHAAKVIATVGTAVAGLNKLDALVPVLKELGLKHVGYGIQPAHYDVVGKALIATLTESLDRAFTPDVHAAWTKVYGIVSTTMIGSTA